MNLRLRSLVSSPVLILLATVTGSLPVHAQIVNGGFETGDTSGWTVNIPTDFSIDQGGNFLVGVVEATADFSITNNVSFGTKIDHFAGDYALAVATHKSAYSNTGDTFDITASQSFDLQLGDSLSGWAAWYNGDYAHQDTVWVRILDSEGTVIDTPWSRLSGGDAIDGVEYLDASPWTQWNWISPDAGTYTLVLGATTFGDNRFATVGVHDGISLTAVPEPATFAAAFGLLALGVVAIRRLRKPTAR